MSNLPEDVERKLREIAEREGVFSEFCVTNVMVGMTKAFALGRETSHCNCMEAENARLRAQVAALEAQVLNHYAAGWRDRGEADAKLACDVYGDAVQAFGPDEPKMVGSKIAVAILALAAPEQRLGKAPGGEGSR